MIDVHHRKGRFSVMRPSSKNRSRGSEGWSRGRNREHYFEKKSGIDPAAGQQGVRKREKQRQAGSQETGQRWRVKVLTPEQPVYVTKGTTGARNRTLESRVSLSKGCGNGGERDRRTEAYVISALRQRDGGAVMAGIGEAEGTSISPHPEGACTSGAEMGLVSSGWSRPLAIPGVAGGGGSSRMVHRFTTDFGGLVGYEKPRRVPREVTRTIEDTVDKLPGRAAGRTRAGSGIMVDGRKDMRI
ncbi:hypothetical protein FB451DRAFT_1179847 [Mycena latifolia]|nr:hypothetical protein FB451DRAFT_1179847 [Mycena latifolia]